MSFVLFCIINPSVNIPLFLYGACRCKQTTTHKSYQGKASCKKLPISLPLRRRIQGDFKMASICQIPPGFLFQRGSSFFKLHLIFIYFYGTTIA